MLVVGSHPNVRQPSMALFSGWLLEALREEFDAHECCAPAVFLRRRSARPELTKWLLYIDQYVIFSAILFAKSLFYDLVLVADQGNAPSTFLVARKKLLVMIHDTIAIRQAMGTIPGAPSVGAGGRLLQRAIVAGLRRTDTALSNPGIVASEIRSLGLARHVHVVGCKVDTSRFRTRSAVAAPQSGPPFVLNVASDGWRKRKLDLIAIWKEVEKRSPLGLMLVGHTAQQTEDLIRAAGLKQVTVLNDVSDDELTQLYASCAGLISPSHEEGLCIPVIEALSFGKTVFLPDVTPSYADFFGDAVFRLPGAADAAAELLIQTVAERTAPAHEVERVLAWSSHEAFNQRVREAVGSVLQARVRNHPAAEEGAVLDLS